MKKQWMKQVLGLALSATLLIGCVNPVSAAATKNNAGKDTIQLAEIEEVEAVRISQNDLDGKAIALTLNQPATDMLETKEEEKWYRFDITQIGYFNVQFSVDALTDQTAIDAGWDIEIYKKGDLVNPIKSCNNIEGGAGYTFPKMPMGAGIYYIKVAANNTFSDGTAPTGCLYNLSVNFTPDNYWEVEGNDTNPVANTIAVNTSYSGNLYHREDVDWYKTTVTNDGYIQLSLTVGDDCNIDDIDQGWDIYVYNSAYEEIKSYKEVKASATAPILPFSKGTYYIKICAYNSFSNGTAPTDCTYKLKLASTASDMWETEKNDTNTDADVDVIAVNKEYRGLLYHAKDVDWYKVTTTVNGYFQIKFTVDGSVNTEDIDDGWDVTVYDGDRKEIKTYDRLRVSGISQVLPYEKGTYYIRVKAYNSFSNGTAPTDCIYGLSVLQTASSVWESEGNDERSKADNISLDKTYNGVFTHNKDVDWYKITLKEAGVIKLALNKDASADIENINSGWDVYVYDVDSASEISSVKEIQSKGSLELALAKGTYYIKVCSYNSFSDGTAPTQCIYQFKVNYSSTPAQVKISKATPGKKQVTLTWKKAKNATGYYIYRSTSKNGTYKKIATIKKANILKYTDKKSLKSKKNYYYKVVAYHTVNGVTAVAKDSAVKKAKTK